MIDKSLEGSHVVIVPGGIENAVLAKPDVITDIGFDTAPDSQGLDNERQFLGRPSLLAHETPVAARLFSGNPALFEEDDRNVPLGQENRLSKHR